jgi:aspartate racemase
MLHIAHVVAAEAVKQRFRRVGLLGTQALVESGLYDHWLAQHDIEAVRPSRPHVEALNGLIFGELARGIVSAEGRQLMGAIWQHLKAEEKCEAVALVCTELPLLIDPSLGSLGPFLDSTRLLARAAVERSVGSPTH